MNGTAANSQPLSFKVLTILIWAALPAEALLYAAAWRQLPARLATHFSFNNQPSGWMSREASFTLAICFATLLAMTATVILLRVRKPDALAWALLGLFYVVQGTLLWAENVVIAYNAQGTPVQAAPVFAVGIIAAVFLVPLALFSGRRAALPTGTVLATERHSSAVLAAVMAIPPIAFAVLIANIPPAGIKLVLGLGAMLLAMATFLAWTGFHYIFTPAGVEIRTAGFRLRSIPAADIRSYAVDRWNVIGGYGIRGVGDKRAYVWGNTGVRIKLNNGEVFLGHSEPGRIIHDLDLITRLHEKHP